MSITLKTNFDQLLSHMDEAAAEVVAETVEAIAEAGSESAPKRTGSLAESVYFVTPDYNGHSQAEAAARRVNSQVEILPPMPLEGGEDGMHAGIVDVAAAHGPYVHNGTGSMAGRPFLEEAGLSQAQAFEQRMRAALKQL